MPGSDGSTEPRGEPRPTPRFRRPPAEEVARAARRIVRGSRASFPSQVAFREALLELLRREEPLATVGSARLRRLLVGIPGIRLSVRYSERPSRPVPVDCPVCGSELTPVRNRTLAGGTVVLGKRCSRCDYWTHAVCRVPVRYTVSQASGRGPGARGARASAPKPG